MRDVQNRFENHARKLCHQAEVRKQQWEAQDKERRNIVESYLEGLGVTYDEAKLDNHCSEFEARGVKFSAYDIGSNRPNIKLTCSPHCLRQILRLVREDHEFHAPIIAKAAAKLEADFGKRRAQIEARRRLREAS